MKLFERVRGGARLPLAVALAASLVAGSLTVTTLASGAEEAPESTSTTSTTVPPDTGPIVTPHTIPPSDSPVDPDAPLPTEPLGPADPAAPVAPLRDPTPHIRVLLADLATIEARKAIPSAQATVDAASAELTNRQLELSAAKEQHQAAVNALDATRRAFSELAVVSFMYANGGTNSGDIAASNMFEQQKGAELTGAVMEHQKALIEEANAKVAATDGAILEREMAVAKAEQAVADQRVGLDAASDVFDAVQAERLVAGNEDVDKLFDPTIDGGRAPNPDPDKWQLTLAGQSAFTVEELQAWFRQWKNAPQASVPAEELAKLYVEEGNLENIRGDVMLAQSIWETGTFSNDDTHRLNNFAGIGHCDTCPEGFGFASARDGVRGQAQLLKSYVEANPTYANPLVDRRLRGPAACCQTWNQLTGVWASAPTYGPLILGLYEDMLEWLLMVRSAAATP